MLYLLARHKVQDYDQWHGVFRSHASVQRQAGLHLLHLLRGVDDPDDIVALFRVDDLEKARAFTSGAGARQAGRVSGVLGAPEIVFLQD